LNTGRGCSNLGISYAKGKGVKQDDFKAVVFFQKACGLNDGGGCSNLGVSYEYGKGIRKSGIKALEYYGKALFNTFAFVMHKPKIRTPFAFTQITRLLVTLYCFEIILFNTFAFVIRKPKIRTTFANIQTTRFLVKQSWGFI
jgi:hypothetical protein